MRWHDANALARQVEGWMGSDDQAEFMFNLGRASARAAEIGAFKGLSSALVGLGMLGHGQYYCIDTFDGSNPELPTGDTYTAWSNHMARLGLLGTCVPVVGHSLWLRTIRAVPDDLDFLYVDGSHDTASVYADIRAWRTKLRPGGLMCFHDSTWDSVAMALRHAVEDGHLVPHAAWDDFAIYRPR
jgi:predicted O-methyltransferase YrrM